MNKIIITENHEYLLNGFTYVSVTTLLKHFGMSPDYDSFGTDYSRSLGTVLHEACALLDEDNLGEFDPAITGRLMGYKKFLEMYQPKWEIIEKPLVSVIWRFAGTPDRYGVMDMKNIILDIKSGYPDDSHNLQTAGYEILLNAFLVGKKKMERYALYLMENDFKLVKHEDKTDESIFLALTQAYNWKLNHNKIKEPLWKTQN